MIGGMDINSSQPTMNNSEGNGSGQASCRLMEVSGHPFFTVTYSMVFLVGLILNSFTVRVYFCQAKRPHSSVTLYLQNLAASDFFLSLCLPLRIANYATHSSTYNSTLIRHIYCNFGATAFYLNMYASILFMDYIAANRYLKIVRPLETHPLQRVRSARYISIATWVTLFTVSSIYLIISLNTTWGTEPISEAMGCDAFHTSNLRLLYKIVHSFSLAIFVFVLVSLLLLYCSTVRRLRVAQQSQLSSGTSKMLSRSKRNMLVLVAVFCVCFVPYHLVRLPYAYFRSHQRSCAFQQAFYYLKELTVLLSVLNACLDPLIYFIFCKAFRSHLGIKSGFSATTTHAVTTPSLEGRRSLSKTNTLPGTLTKTSFNMSRRATIT